jgi:protein-disulfide isomerase
MKIIIAVLVAATILLTSCSSPDLLSRDPSVFLDKKIESPFFGNKSAKVQMMVFTDFQCPACIQFEEVIGGELFGQYVDTGKIGLEYRMFPLSIHKNAPEDALAALCSESQGKFKEFSKEMYGLEEQKK